MKQINSFSFASVEEEEDDQMSAGTSASFCLIVCFLVCSSKVLEIIRAERGQDVILPCKAPNKDNINNIRAVEWSRPDHDPDYVLLYRDGHLDPHNQHPSYQNRVDLQDKEMKYGDVSLILKNVKMEDTGTYVCRVFQGQKNEHISIYLKVHLSGDQDEITGDGGDKTGIILGSVGSVILLAVSASVGFVIYTRHKRQML